MYKCIFQGRLDFRNKSSYDKAYIQYEQRLETYYKNEVEFKLEDVFDQEAMVLNVPRTVSQMNEKFWKNTIGLLEYISQFALSGKIEAWRIEEGQILEYAFIEPLADKAVIMAYQKGKTLSEEDGKEEKAIESLTKAIENFNKHSQAYERRGYTNYKLGNLRDAKYDFDKSIIIDPRNAHAYFGRAVYHIKQGNDEEAISDLDNTIKNSIAHQSVFWRARRMKGNIHMKLEQWEEAAREFKFFSMRKFKDGDPNAPHQQAVKLLYCKVMIEAEQFREATAFIDKLLLEESDELVVNRGKLLTYRGIARQRLGMKGFKKDLEEAVSLGEDHAREYLATL